MKLQSCEPSIANIKNHIPPNVTLLQKTKNNTKINFLKIDFSRFVSEQLNLLMNAKNLKEKR